MRREAYNDLPSEVFGRLGVIKSPKPVEQLQFVVDESGDPHEVARGALRDYHVLWFEGYDLPRVYERVAILIEVISQCVQRGQAHMYICGREMSEGRVGYVDAHRSVLIDENLVFAAESALLDWFRVFGAARKTSYPLYGPTSDVRDLPEDRFDGRPDIQVIVRVCRPLYSAPWASLTLLRVYDLGAARAGKETDGRFAAVLAPTG